MKATWKWFGRTSTVAEVKSLYRKLAMEHHPDHGGDTRMMQEINAEYHARLSEMDGQISYDEQNTPHEYHYNQRVEQEVMDKIAALLGLKMAGVEIELVGTWVWISGNTKPYKDALKTLGCCWHGKRIMWYWRKFTCARHYSGAGFDYLRDKYGSKNFENEPTASEGSPRRAAPALAGA